jgi:hypothetical protein
MKIIRLLILLILFFSTFFLNAQSANAIYDPLSVPNNKFGIHILFPEELNNAAKLINSNGGDWGYVAIPIKASDKNIPKWQKFMNDCKQDHVIPLIRLATDGDFFSQGSWSKPNDADIMDFANFLNSLNWPTQNRYIIVYNEPNRGDEWGGVPNALEYAGILDYAVTEFKSVSPDFFIISAGLDNASINDPKGQAINEFTYMSQMNEAVDGIFGKIDGLGSHSYPNPGFAAPPSALRVGIYSFYYQNNYIYSLTGKTLPVFITETGWSSDVVSYSLQSNYYRQTLDNYWNDINIVAITPFVFNAGVPFTQFSFLKSDNQTEIYNTYKNFSKTKGEPILAKDFVASIQNQLNHAPVKKFSNTERIKSIFEGVNKSTKTFFKWLLKA